MAIASPAPSFLNVCVQGRCFFPCEKRRQQTAVIRACSQKSWVAPTWRQLDLNTTSSLVGDRSSFSKFSSISSSRFLDARSICLFVFIGGPRPESHVGQKSMTMLICTCFEPQPSAFLYLSLRNNTNAKPINSNNVSCHKPMATRAGKRPHNKQSTSLQQTFQTRQPAPPHFRNSTPSLQHTSHLPALYHLNTSTLQRIVDALWTKAQSLAYLSIYAYLPRKTRRLPEHCITFRN